MALSEDEKAVLQFAAKVSGELNQVDQSVVSRPSNQPPAKRIDVQNFAPPGSIPRGAVQGGTPLPQQKHTFIKPGDFVEEPKNRALGADVVGTEQVDISSMLIPIPEDLQKFAPAEKQSVIPTPAQPVEQKVQAQAQTKQPEVKQPEIINKTVKKINKIDKKLNKIIRMLGSK